MVVGHMMGLASAGTFTVRLHLVQYTGGGLSHQHTVTEFGKSKFGAE